VIEFTLLLCNHNHHERITLEDGSKTNLLSRKEDAEKTAILWWA